MLQVISVGVYYFIDPDATLYFVTTIIPRKFDIFPYILNEHYMVTTPIWIGVFCRCLILEVKVV